MLIFILTLIFVGGAFALYQWGDQVLVRMATPQGHYQEPPKGSGPSPVGLARKAATKKRAAKKR